MKRGIQLFAVALFLAVPGAVPAFAQVEPGEIETACMGASNMPQPICACLEGKLMSEEYTDLQREWFLLVLSDQDTAKALVPQMSQADMVEIAMFSTSGPAECAAGG